MNRTYTPAIDELLKMRPAMPLGPGEPHHAAEPKLRQQAPATLLAPHPIRSEAAARACLAGLWLAHNFLEQSHQISQEIETIEGSFWHGIMHRREPDYWNAKYWFRRVGRHPIFEPLAEQATRLALTTATTIATPSPWDPFLFVDWCEQAADDRSPLRELCLRVQAAEWQLLFDYCYDQALGRPR